MNNILILLLLTTSTTLSAARQCFINHKLDMFAFRLEAGYWQATARAQHVKSKGSAQSSTDQWVVKVDVDQCGQNCVGGEYVNISAIATEPTFTDLPGYELFPGVGYYKFHTEAKTWDEARKICNEEGGHLAVINSAEESRALKNLFARVSTTVNTDSNVWAYIGFHDRFVEGEYISIFDQPIEETGFTGWCPSQPDNLVGDEDCGTFHRNGCLNDGLCLHNLTFFCEKELC